ncbi:MAG: hypothetical protein AAB295_12870 [Chloroflexota bacterium]
MAKRLPRTRTLKGEVKLAHYYAQPPVGGLGQEPSILLLHASLTRSED